MTVFGSTAEWETFGAVLITAAIVGTGGQIAGIPIPVIQGTKRQIVLLVFGAATFYWGWQLTNFRVSKVAFELEPTVYKGPCPAQVLATGTIRVRGGEGDVSYRLSYGGKNTAVRTIHFPRATGRFVSWKLHLTDNIRGNAMIRISAPDQVASRVRRLVIRCTARGYHQYIDDGYAALYPSGWRITQNDVVRTTYHRTKFVSGDGDYFVLIDWTPAVKEVTPPKLASGDRRFVNGRTVRLDHHLAREWQFMRDGSRRVDYVFRLGHDQFAVLAQGPDFAAVVPIAKNVAASITLR